MAGGENLYDAQYFEGLRWRVLPSVGAVVPEVVSRFQPRTALDLGCGDASWSRALGDAGVFVTAVDAADVPREPHSHVEFKDRDLSTLEPGELGRVDVCLCLEVAEHLPIDVAEHLVDVVASASDAVVFSAATPGQGGTGHLNEQPHEFWLAKFESRGFDADVTWRDRFAGRDEIAPWYRANLMLFERGR